MIKYDPGRTGLFFIFSCKGSVFPKALIWAIPNAILAVLLHMYMRQEQVDGNPLSMTGINLMWGGYTSVLGFLVVFRNNQAYTRFWEGASLIHQVRAEWFNAVTSCVSFSNSSPEFKEKVEQFQLTLVCFASMLLGSAIHQVCDLDNDDLEIIELRGLDQDSTDFLRDSNDRCEVLVSWIQRLIVEAHEANTIKIAPPLLTRAFQELSRGSVNLNTARKIKDIPFPFPYAQMITVMLIVHWVATPIIASQVMESVVGAGSICFFVTLSFWVLIYIALEIDQPFGDDANDLPLREMQHDFNRSLLNLLHPLSQKVPGHQMVERPSVISEDAVIPRMSGTVSEKHRKHMRLATFTSRSMSGRVSSASRPGRSTSSKESDHAAADVAPGGGGEADLQAKSLEVALEEDIRECAAAAVMRPSRPKDIALSSDPCHPAAAPAAASARPAACEPCLSAAVPVMPTTRAVYPSYGDGGSSPSRSPPAPSRQEGAARRVPPEMGRPAAMGAAPSVAGAGGGGASGRADRGGAGQMEDCGHGSMEGSGQSGGWRQYIATAMARDEHFTM